MSKYHSRKVEIDGIVFDSVAESLRYSDLKLLEYSGEISNLKIHHPFPLVVNGKLVCKYVADFVYIKDGVEIVEDVKGMKTAVYNLKKKLMKAVYGVDIFESRIRRRPRH